MSILPRFFTQKFQFKERKQESCQMKLKNIIMELDLFSQPI